MVGGDRVTWEKTRFIISSDAPWLELSVTCFGDIPSGASIAENPVLYPVFTWVEYQIHNVDELAMLILVSTWSPMLQNK
jgi:hypothetical protein